jgi:hypothetical protein
VDELLYERVKQLKDIEERLERIILTDWPDPAVRAHAMQQQMIQLRRDVLDMVAEAERQHAEF